MVSAKPRDKDSGAGGSRGEEREGDGGGGEGEFFVLVGSNWGSSGDEEVLMVGVSSDISTIRPEEDSGVGLSRAENSNKEDESKLLGEEGERKGKTEGKNLT